MIFNTIKHDYNKFSSLTHCSNYTLFDTNLGNNLTSLEANLLRWPQEGRRYGVYITAA